MGHLFFCYARDDSAFALKLARDLTEAGADIWIDQVRLKPADNYELEIEKAIESADALLVVMSPRSVDRPNVRNEVKYGRDHAKIIYPVLMEPCKIPIGLRLLQYIDFTRDYGQGLRSCMTSIESLLGTAAAPVSRARLQSRSAAAGTQPTTTEHEVLAGARILWVDDRPENSAHERAMLESRGALVTLADDTTPALKLLAETKFNLVISDMERPSGRFAGYDLLAALRKWSNATPFVIYASTRGMFYTIETRRRGGQGRTNDPRELLELAVACLKGR